MTHDEAVRILEMITDVYPKSQMNRNKAMLLLPALKEMDYDGVMKKLSAFVATYPYPPTLAEIAVYPKEENETLQKINRWRREADKVAPEMKMNFRREMQRLMKEKGRS